ncbi:MAG: CRISPR-associated protein Cas4 [Oxalobacter formigenes]|nr:CRISPR-associated protein Cas4 [Oxalobacter formigenes]
MTLSESYPVYLLRQHLFCPRIPWFNVIKNLHPATPPWVNHGIRYHEVQQALSKRRNLSRYGLDNRYRLAQINIGLSGKQWPVHGICDALLESPDALCPIEMKSGEQLSHTSGAKIQLVAYALMLEETLQKPVNKGFVLYGNRGKVYEVAIDKPARSWAHHTLMVLLSNMEQYILPDSSASAAQCGQCEYQNFCADRL